MTTRLFLFITLLILPALAQAQETPFTVDEVVAIVGNEIILRSDVQGLVAAEMQRNPNLTYSDAIWEQALEALINEKVLLTHAMRDTTIAVTAQQIESVMENRINQLAQQVGGLEQLEQAYGRPLDQIRMDLRENTREQLMIEQLTSRKLREVKITPTEVRSWFRQFDPDSLPVLPETVHLAHIVRIPDVAPEARQEALQIIQTIQDSIRAGVPIEDLARRYSDDPGSAENGGRYESFSLGDLVPEFGVVAAQLRPGEFSQIFESSFGYHIMRLNSRVGDIVDFNHVLIRIDDSKIDPAGAIELLHAVRDSILTHNRPFERMAKEYSEEPESANRGGLIAIQDPQSGQLIRDLPVIQLGPDWQRTLDTLEVGEISLPAEARLLTGTQQRAYHIVQLLRRTPEHRVDFETDFDRIRAFALQDKRARIQGEWLEQLRSDVYINLLSPAPPDSLSAANR